MNEADLKQIKNYLFVIGGVFAAVIGMYFSKSGFGFEIKDMEWVGYGLGALCFIVQIAFSSQLAYRSYNWVIFLCGVLAYVYSGWSNYTGIMGLNPSAHPAFAFLLGEFMDWVAEPLIVFGLIGVTDSADGDFLRNLFGRKHTNHTGQQSAGYQTKTPTAQSAQRPVTSIPVKPFRPSVTNTPFPKRPERPVRPTYPKEYDNNIFDK